MLKTNDPERGHFVGRPGAFVPAGRIVRVVLDIREEDINTPAKQRAVVKWLRETVFTRVKPCDSR
jgi:hypothetical protein